MLRRNSALSQALRGAQLANEVDAMNFWDLSIGKAKQVREKYIEYRALSPILDKVIVYETMFGARISDNPYALFEYLISHPKYKSYLHVWSTAEGCTIPEKYTKVPNVVFARRGTRSYAYFLACAKHLICNANLPRYFTRRPGQKYLNTWHGIPYKALGRNAPESRYGSPPGTASFLKATHVLSPCEFMTDRLVSAYSMSGSTTAKIAETGQPRVDIGINLEGKTRSLVKRSLGLDSTARSDGYRPSVLYAPTWRAEDGKGTVNTERLVNDLEALASLDVHLMYRGHHRTDKLLEDEIVGGQIENLIIPPQTIGSNELLTAVDILITDYSSIFFDFLPTGRPIIHYLYDIDEYERTRGLNLKPNELPGTVVRSRKDLVGAVTAVSRDLRTADDFSGLPDKPLQGDKYTRAKLRFCPIEDGNASKRAVKFFFKGRTRGLCTRRPSGQKPAVAFWAGSLRDDPDSELFIRSLEESADSADEQTVLVIDNETPANDALLNRIQSIGDSVSIVPYTVPYVRGNLTILAGESSEYKAFMVRDFVDLEEVRNLLRSNFVLRGLFSHEYRRRLDDSQFSRLVLAPNLNNHEKALASFAVRDYELPATDRALPHQTNLTELRRTGMPKRTLDTLAPHGSTRRKLAKKSLLLVLPKSSARRRSAGRHNRKL